MTGELEMLHEHYGYEIAHQPVMAAPLLLLVSLVTLALLVVGVLLAARSLGWHRSSHFSSLTPVDVLIMRYAKGEIDRGEYETIKRAILESNQDEPTSGGAEAKTQSAS